MISGNSIPNDGLRPSLVFPGRIRVKVQARIPIHTRCCLNEQAYTEFGMVSYHNSSKRSEHYARTPRRHTCPELHSKKPPGGPRRRYHTQHSPWCRSATGTNTTGQNLSLDAFVHMGVEWQLD